MTTIDGTPVSPRRSDVFPKAICGLLGGLFSLLPSAPVVIKGIDRVVDREEGRGKQYSSNNKLKTSQFTMR